MQAHYAKAVVAESGSVTVGQLPFAAGESVEVVIFPERRPVSVEDRCPLRGKPFQFAAPTAPVAKSDWEGLP